MQEVFARKYKKVLEILPDVAQCADGKLVLVGGTALALFYLSHRHSIDLDFVPVSGSDIALKESLKGCLSKKGFRTSPGVFHNQFVVQFEDTSIKVEVFEPEEKINQVEERIYGGAKVKVASLEDIFRMKQSAYADRKEARDLFDIFCILKSKKENAALVKKLILQHGAPKNLQDIEEMAANPDEAAAFQEVVTHASA